MLLLCNVASCVCLKENYGGINLLVSIRMGCFMVATSHEACKFCWIVVYLALLCFYERKVNVGLEWCDMVIFMYFSLGGVPNSSTMYVLWYCGKCGGDGGDGNQFLQGLIEMCHMNVF